MNLKRFFSFLSIACIAGSAAHAYNGGNVANQSNWSTAFVQGSDYGYSTYTIGSGALASNTKYEWWRTFTAGGLITLDATYNLAWIPITADSGSSGVTLTSPNGTNALVLTSGSNASGISLDYNNAAVNASNAINAPIYIGNAGAGTGVVVFANETFASQNDTLNFGTAANRYNIQGLQTSSATDPVFLVLYGLGNGTINDNIIDGTGQGMLSTSAVISLDFVSAATWTLTGTNTYSGPTLVTGGGTLLLDDSSNNNQKLSQGALTIGGTYGIGGAGGGLSKGGGGTLELEGSSSGSSTQSVSSTTIAQGPATIEVVSGTGQSATFNLGTLKRTAAGTVNFQLVNTGGGTAAMTTTTLDGTAASSGISNAYMLGSFATLNGTDWADVNGAGSIVAATYANDVWGSTSNTNVTTTDTAGGLVTNSLRFAAANATTLTLAGGANQILSGGILMSSAVGNNNVTITGGTSLASGYDSTGGTTNELIVQQFDTQGTLFIQSTVGTAGSPILTLAGGGTLNLSGTNTALTTVNIDSGTLQAGSSTPFGAAATVNLDGNSAVLDLNGFNVSVGNLNSYNLGGGITAQTQGMAPVVKNGKAGTNATLTVSGGTYQGALVDGSGAVLNIVKTGGGTANIESGYWSDGLYDTEGNGPDGALPQGLYEVLNGGVTVTGGNLTTNGDLYLLGAVNLASGTLISSFNNNGGGYANISTTFLTGLGSVNEYSAHSAFFVNLGLNSSSTDTYAGGVNAGRLVIEGSGNFVLSAAQGSSNFNFLDVLGTTTVQTLGLTSTTASASGLSAVGYSTIKIIGTSGSIANGIDLAGGTLWIAPTGSSSTVSLSAATPTNVALVYGGGDAVGNQVNSVNGNGTVALDRGTNSNLNLTLGNAASTNQDIARNGRGTLVIAATDGTSALGGTEKLSLLGTSTALLTKPSGIDMVSATVVGAAATTGSSGVTLGQGTFLTYSGTGVAADTGFTAVTYTDTNFAASTAASIEQVNGTSTSISTAQTVFALQDNGTLTNTSTLTIGNGSAVAGLILNNGTINGSGTLSSGASELAIYTYGVGTINNTISTTNGLTVFGPGTLYLTKTPSYTGITTINSGVLDVESPITSFTLANNTTLANGSNIQIQGGVLQTSGTITRGLGTGNGQLTLYNGGFSASSSAGLVVNLGGSVIPATLTWGSGAFMSDASVLQLGSPTALGLVNFKNNIVLGGLGTSQGSNSGGPALYREIGVTDNPNSFDDYAEISGNITDVAGDYRGIEKVGNGMLWLTGTNTYYGPTVIAAGTLAFGSDSNLGTDPSQAYAITNTVTLGALQIDGGATLYEITGSTGNVTTLSANRTVLLGGGGASGMAVYSGEVLQVDSRIGDAINTIAAGNGSGGGSLDINPITGAGYDASQTNGDVVFTSNFNTYSGGTTVEQGTFFANNTLSTSSATGTGSVNIKSGAVLRGTGYIAPASHNSVTIASGASLNSGDVPTGTAAVGSLSFVSAGAGSGAVLTFTTPASSMTLPQLDFSLGDGTNNGTGAGLVFNGITLAGSSNYINLPVDSAGEVVFSLDPTLPTLIELTDLTGGSLAYGDYLLFAGKANTDYANLTTDMDGMILTGLALAPDQLPDNSGTLYLQNGNIYLDVEVAPEPSTWAMLLLGSLALLGLSRVNFRSARN